MSEHAHRFLRGHQDRSHAPLPQGGGLSKREKFKWGSAGPTGEFRIVPKTDLYVDERYQREISSKSRIVDMAKSWDWALCGCLLVGERPTGTKVILDGQNRWMAATYRDDIDSLPCLVFPMDSLSDEAMMFYMANTSAKSVTPYHKHRARVVGGDPVAIASEEILGEHGYSVSRSSNEPRTLKAIATLHRMVQRDRKLSAKVVALCAEICAGEAMSQRLLMAISWIAERDDSVFSSPHRGRLVEYGSEVLDAAMERHRLVTNKGGERVYAEAVLELANKGRRSRKLCE